MNNDIKILIADDHPIFRHGLRQIIERDPRLRVIAEADDGEAALRLIESMQPQVALLDLDMPGLDGFGVARQVREAGLAVTLVFLTMHNDEMHFNEALDLGAKGYVLKDSAAADVVNCLKTVVTGQHYISPALSTYLLNRHQRASTLLRQPGLQDLTDTERRVLALLAEYKTSKQIADELGVSVRTIENHRARICQKLDLHGSHALVKFAIRHKSELS
ncbi:MAG TPA: response regulator transcription factor [Blastocatellia bacterium]|jgi:DNA-binding NarL/FixJ family response regulator